MDYTSYKSTIANLMATDETLDTGFISILPSIIAYAEDRIYQEMDLIQILEESTVDCVPGTRTVTVPSIDIVHSASLITPAGALPAVGTRVPLQRVSIEFLNYFWPGAGTTGVPSKYAMIDHDTMALAPTPNAAYKIATTGPVTPARLSASNPTTWVLENLESVFVSASMIFAAGFQKNFGAQGDDPKMAQSWEAQYQTLKASAEVQEARRKAQSVQWQPYSPSPAAKDSRT